MTTSIKRRRIFSNSIEEINEISNLYLNEDYSVKQLCTKYNCSSAVIQRFLHKNGIKKKGRFIPTYDNIVYINKRLSEGATKKEIATELGIQAYLLCAYIRKNNEYGKYSNRLQDESWIDENNPIFWYFLGFFTADGHLSNSNIVSLFQKERVFIQELKTMITHTGKLYGSPKCWVLNINSPILHKKLEELGFSSDKRYSAPYVEAPNNEFKLLYLRGLFDGDGSIYYNYISGIFNAHTFEICSGSSYIKEGVNSLLTNIGLKSHVDVCTSSVGNPYYKIVVRNKEDIVKLFFFLYKDFPKYRFTKKYIRYYKLIKLIELDTQVEDIVDASMKIED